MTPAHKKSHILFFILSVMFFCLTGTSYVQIADLDELDYGGNRTTAACVVFPERTVDFTIPPMPEASFNEETGELTVYDINGTPHIVPTEKNADGESVFPMIITDKEGDRYRVDIPEDTPQEAPDGETKPEDAGNGAQKKAVITRIETLAGGIDTSQLSAASPVTVRFFRGAGKYALDEGTDKHYKRSVKLSKYYELFGKEYVAPWKLVPTGKSDVVEAFAIGSGAPFERGKLRFALKDGTEIPARDEEGKWTLTLPGVGKGETYEVFALYETAKGKYATGKYSTAGKLNVVSYPEQRHMVTLVEVDGQAPQAASLQDRLNSIYNAYGIYFTVNTDDILKGNIAWDIDGDGKLDVGGSGFFTNETVEMKALRQLYQNTPGSQYEKSGYYLFMVDRADASGEPDEEFAVQGDMPRGKQFGYLFTTSAEDIGRLAAHELGHGIFTLPHTFDVNLLNNDSKGQTSNLMDYGDGIELAVWQWNVMANPAPMTWFDDDGDAMLRRAIPEKLLAKLAELGDDHIVFGANCVSHPNSDNTAVLADNYKYCIIKLNKSAHDKLPEFIEFKPDEVEINYETTKLDLQPAGEVFIVQVRKEGIYNIPVVCELEAAKYSLACEWDRLLASKDFKKNILEDFSKCAGQSQIDEIIEKIREKLMNEFYRDVKVCVTLTSFLDGTEKTSHTLQTPGLDKCENAEILINIELNTATNQVNISLKTSDKYLDTVSPELRDKASAYENDWGIAINLDDLRRQIITDLENPETVESFYGKLAQKVKTLLSDKIATVVEAVQVSQKVTKNVWETGEVNRSIWHGSDPEHGLWPEYAHLDPVTGGISDGVIGEIVGIPVAIKSFYGIMTDSEQRKALASMFTKEGLSQLWETFSSEIKDDEEVRDHFVSRTTIEVASLFVPGMGITKTGKIGDIVGITTDGIENIKGVRRLNEKVDAIINKSKNLPERKMAMKDFFTSMDPKLINQLMEIDNFDAVIKEMAQSWMKFHGEKFVFEHIGRQGDGFVRKIKAFEAVMDDASSYSCDILLIGDRKLEYKSWTTQFLKKLLKEEQAKKQLKNYIKEGDFQYIFDRKKLLKEVVNPDLFVKEEFRKLFLNNAEDFFKQNETFFKNIKIGPENVIDSWKKLQKVAADPELFNKLIGDTFIKVE